MTEEVLYSGLLPREKLPAFITECGFRTETPSGATTYFLAENQPEYVIQPADRQHLLIFKKFNPDDPFESADIYDYKKYSSGRIFSQQGELRWERQNEQIHIIYLGNLSFASIKNAIKEVYTSRFKEKRAELALLEPRTEPSFYYLFGTKLEKRTIEQINGNQLNNVVKIGDFAELRIHRVLDYPAPGQIQEKDYVQLQVQEYIDPTSGHVQLFRFQGLVPAKEQAE